MAYLTADHGDAFDRPTKKDDPGLFAEMWPGETASNGRLAGNNVRTGRAQGKGSFLRKAYCKLCGWPNDLNKVDHTGGSEDGDGAGGGVTKATTTATLSSGAVLSDTHGDQALRKNSGCAMCFSKNNSNENIERVEAMNPIPPLGF